MSISPAVLTLALAWAAPGQAPATDASSASATEGDRLRVLALDLEAFEIPVATAKVFQGTIADALAGYAELDVVTSSDLAAIADLEGQKEVAGCDDASCLADLAGAMGARYIVYGRLARIEDLVVVQLNLWDSESTAVITRQNLQEESLTNALRAVGPAVEALVAPLLASARTAEAAGSTTSPGADPATTTGAENEPGEATETAAVSETEAASEATAAENAEANPGEADGKDKQDEAVPDAEDGTPTQATSEEKGLNWLSIGLIGGGVVLAAGAALVVVAGLSTVLAGEWRLSVPPAGRADFESNLWTTIGPLGAGVAALAVLGIAGGTSLVVWGVIE